MGIFGPVVAAAVSIVIGEALAATADRPQDDRVFGYMLTVWLLGCLAWFLGVFLSFRSGLRSSFGWAVLGAVGGGGGGLPRRSRRRCGDAAITLQREQETNHGSGGPQWRAARRAVRGMACNPRPDLRDHNEQTTKEAESPRGANEWKNPTAVSARWGTGMTTRKRLFVFASAVAGGAVGFVAVAWLVVQNRIGGEMRAIPALEFGLLLGAPIGGVAGAILGVWLTRTR